MLGFKQDVGAMSPAESVHLRFLGDVHFAVDRIAEVLLGGEQQREEEQNACGKLVMQFEYVVIRVDLLQFGQRP